MGHFQSFLIDYFAVGGDMFVDDFARYRQNLITCDVLAPSILYEIA